MLLELIRYKNCAMAGIAAVIGAAIAYSSVSGDIFLLLPVFMVVFFITCAGNAVNDYFDVEIDRINRPERPIPSGRLKRESAYKFSIFLFVLGIALSYSISTIPFMIAVFNSLLLYIYALFLKKRVFIGNLSVGYLSGSTFLFGGSAYGYDGIRFTLVLFLLSMLATLAREIVKSIEDMEGDRKNKATTLPLLIGERPAAYIASLTGVVAVILSPVPYLTGLFDKHYLFAVAIADGIFLYAVLLILKKKPSSSSSYFKAGMFFALMAFVAGAFYRMPFVL